MDIQKYLDDLLDGNAEAQKAIERLWYVPEGADMPAGVTQTLRLGSVLSPDIRALTIGIETKTPYGFLLDTVLSLIATAPPVQIASPRSRAA